MRAAAVYESLLEFHGPQQWWPAKSRFEIMAGALLVQRTTWRNAERALEALRQCGLLDAHALQIAPVETVESCVRSTGFFRAKAARLKSLAKFIVLNGGAGSLDREPTPVLRNLLLALEGVGDETADAILLYAFNRPVVVVDEYLRRLVRRLLAAQVVPPDGDVRQWIVTGVGDDVDRLNELHALVVVHGKQTCRKDPRCGECVIRNGCRTGAAASDT